MVQAFIDPEAALGALTPKPKVVVDVVDLGPSPPHADEPVAAEAPALAWMPSTNPWKPESQPHYVNVLDELWPEFDDLEERTAARLTSLLGEVADEAQRVFKLKQQIWDDLPFYKVPDSERERLDKEFLAYLRRLNDYRKLLDSLEPDSTDTDAVYIGLVKRRQGAGPVPDAIMHMYFADQLGILADHAADMGEGFIGRVMISLDKIDTAAEDAAAGIREASEMKAEEIKYVIEKATNSFSEKLERVGLWIGGIMLGTLVIGGTIAAAVVAGRNKRR